MQWNVWITVSHFSQIAHCPGPRGPIIIVQVHLSFKQAHSTTTSYGACKGLERVQTPAAPPLHAPSRRRLGTWQWCVLVLVLSHLVEFLPRAFAFRHRLCMSVLLYPRRCWCSRLTRLHPFVFRGRTLDVPYTSRVSTAEDTVGRMGDRIGEQVLASHRRD